MSGSTAFISRCLLAILVAGAIDLSLAAGSGYFLRTDVWLLAGLNLLFLSALVVPVMALLYATRWFDATASLVERAPFATVLTAASAPIAVLRLWRTPESSTLLELACVGALLAGLAVFELRRAPGTLSGARQLMAGAAALLAMLLAWWLPTPGRSMLAFASPSSGPPATAQAPNVLLIALDTTRADHLGAYGYARDTTPWLDGFAASATLFERAIATSSYTLPSHASLFTGLHPLAHGARAAEGGVSLTQLDLVPDPAPVRPLSADALTLAEIAQQAKLETGAICSNAAYLSHFFGLNQGFTTYVDAKGVDVKGRPAGLAMARRIPGLHEHMLETLKSNERFYLLASEVNTLALEWLEARRHSRFFLFLNYMDPHTPVLPIGRYQDLFSETGDTAETAETSDPDAGDAVPDEYRAWKDRYDAELRYLDDQLAKLFSTLEQWGLLDDTLVVIVGDHGESFGEHGKGGHAVGIYEPEVHVPLLIRRPGQVRGQRIEHFVSLVDVMPTILAESGLGTSSEQAGRSLLDADARREPKSYLGRYRDDYETFALYRDPWKLLQRSTGEVELYDLRNDPDEARDLASEQPDVVRELSSSLEDFKNETHPAFGDVSTTPPPEVIERLRALGYGS